MPRRHDDLFGRIANFQALHAAARRAIKGKRKKSGAASFFANLESEVLTLERQLRSGEYRPGRYFAFEVDGPKKRIVSAAPFRDRVVHHALYAVVAPIFEAGFIGNTFANRTGKGTHSAIKAYERYRDRHAHVLRCDIYRYFPAIDHTILKSEFRRRIICRPTLTLLDRSNAQEPVDVYFDGDDLFTPFRRRRGLPIRLDPDDGRCLRTSLSGAGRRQRTRCGRTCPPGHATAMINAAIMAPGMPATTPWRYWRKTTGSASPPSFGSCIRKIARMAGRHAPTHVGSGALIAFPAPANCR
jgi:hypothetical protein